MTEETWERDVGAQLKGAIPNLSGAQAGVSAARGEGTESQHATVDRKTRNRFERKVDTL